MPDIIVSTSDEMDHESPDQKGKGKAVLSSQDPGFVSPELLNKEHTVDWTQYAPPAGLKDMAGSDSELIAQVLQESIDRVQARIAEEEERRVAEREAEKSRQEEKLHQEQEQEDDMATYVPSLEEKPSERGPIAALTGLSENSSKALAPQRPVKSKKNSLMNILRRWNNIVEWGESSATGAARHKPGDSQSSFEWTTQTTKKRFVPGILKKTSTESSSSSPHSSINEAQVECVSCLDDFNPNDMIKGPCHSYCKPCFIRLINVNCENEQQWPPKCCLNLIPASTIISNVDNELRQIYRDRAAEWDLPISDRVYCSTSNCSIWIRPNEINHADNLARCAAGHRTCTICRGAPHEGTENCPQDRDMMRTDELAEEEGWKRCYGCRAYVEHREACQHMTCRCGAEFCYVCGLPWRTCGCSMEQLVAVKRDAATRRQEREEREAREEAEAQEAIRLVEEFEREEARKAELLRVEQERLAEERRQRELEERIRREEERRWAVASKFRGIREILANIHELQRAIIQRDHISEQIRLGEEGTASLEKLRADQRADREELDASTKTEISIREMNLRNEYARRVMAERRIENEYHARLKTYWASRKDGDAKIEDAMKKLKLKMDARFSKWEKWRNTDLDNYRWSVTEQQEIQEELMEERERRLVVSTREELVMFSLRKVAELRWVDVVMEEREKMLADMEEDEVENGEDIDAWFADDGLESSSSEEPPESAEDSAPDESDEEAEAELLQEFKVPGAFDYPLMKALYLSEKRTA